MGEIKKSMWLEYLEAIIIAVFLALFIRSFIVQAFKIPSGSMLNTLLIGDQLLVNKFIYGSKIPFTNIYMFRGNDPARDDIIVFEYPNDPNIDYIKRIVGIPGDVLEMRNKVLYRNGEVVNEPYVRHSGTKNPRFNNFAPITVPEDSYFMMGDNRDDSSDSREWGFVKRGAIHGKAWRLYWSWDSQPDKAIGSPRLTRIGKAVE